jgi:hypothetical protein
MVYSFYDYIQKNNSDTTASIILILENIILNYRKKKYVIYTDKVMNVIYLFESVPNNKNTFLCITVENENFWTIYVNLEIDRKKLIQSNIRNNLRGYIYKSILTRVTGGVLVEI